MGTDRRRVARGLALLPALTLLTLPATAHAQAWWEPLAFAGQRVSAVSAANGVISVDTASGRYRSSDGGASFHRVAGADGTPPAAPRAAWAIDRGVVVTTGAGDGPTADPGAPYLGAGAHLIAAPGALPGVVVAVGTDDHVWRRSRGGRWSTSFIVLPAGGLSGPPPVTALAAFTTPLSAAVYLGTDGYGVLLTENGGDDWIRADPGLPESVLGLAADPGARALFAATGQGLFVHHLQSFPAPPAYSDASLYLRWLGIALVALASTGAAVLGLRRALPPPGAPRVPTSDR